MERVFTPCQEKQTNIWTESNQKLSQNFFRSRIQRESNLGNVSILTPKFKYLISFMFFFKLKLLGRGGGIDNNALNLTKKKEFRATRSPTKSDSDCFFILHFSLNLPRAWSQSAGFSSVNIQTIFYYYHFKENEN